MRYTDSISFSMANSQQPMMLTSLHTKGAYVVRLSRSCDLIALGINQKYVDQTAFGFMSTANGSIASVNLRNFGLSEKARGRLEKNKNIDL